MGQVNFKKLLIFPNFIEIFHCCITRLMSKKKNVSWPYLLIRITLRKKNMEKPNFKKLLKFPNFLAVFQFCMTRLRNKKLDVSW